MTRHWAGTCVVAAIAGCRTVSFSSECVTERFTIQDDAIAADLAVRPADVLEVVVGSFAFAGAYDDGAPVAGEGDVARGNGDAIVTDATLVTHSSTSFGFRKDGPHPTTLVTCEDALEVPVDASLRTDDGAIDVAFDGVAVPIVTRADGVPDFFEVQGDIDAEDIDAMPDAPHPALWPGLSIQWTTEDLHWVSLFWEGGDYVQIVQGGPPLADR